MTRLSYAESEELILKLIGMDQYRRRAAIKNLTKDELNAIRHRVGYFATAANDLKAGVKLQVIVSEADYDKYVKHAAKHFNDIDIAILEGLSGDDNVWYYRGLERIAKDWLVDNDREEKLESYGEGLSGEAAELDAIKKSVKKLKRRGLLLHVKGLLGEDGAAGSGFGINEDLSGTIDNIIASYKGVSDQGELL